MTPTDALQLTLAMAAPGGEGGGAREIFSFLPFMLAMMAIMYFLMIRPQQKQRRERDTMLGALKKGDRVVTTSGLHGTITGLTDERVVLRVSDQVKLEFDRAAIGRVVDEASEK